MVFVFYVIEVAVVDLCMFVIGVSCGMSIVCILRLLLVLAGMLCWRLPVRCNRFCLFFLVYRIVDVFDLCVLFACKVHGVYCSATCFQFVVCELDVYCCT